MTNTTITALPTASGIDGTADYIPIDTASPNITNKINRNTFLGVTGTPMDISTIQSVTNKTLGNTNTVTLKSNKFTVQDSSDTTKQAVLSLSGITTATTRTLTVPDRSSTIATLGGNQAFTGANTFSGSSWSGGTIDNTTVTVDAVAGHTASTNGTIYGMSVSSAALSSSTSLGDGIVLPKALMTGAGSTWGWSSWSVSATNISLGSGGSFTTGYIQEGKKVSFRLRAVLGTGGAVAGVITFSLPIAAIAEYGNSEGYVLSSDVKFLRPATFEYYGMAKIVNNNPTKFFLSVTNSASTYSALTATSGTVPFTWQSGDVIAIKCDGYEVA